MSSTGQTIFSALFEDAPIIFQDGIASALPGGILPVTLITEVFDVPGIINGQLFAKYRPVPGGTLADWQIAEYPFASLQVAANAVIQQPLKISMMMICPAQNNGGLIFKQAILTALKLAVESHILSGGSFTVITPAFTYFNCLLTNIRDITPPTDKQAQYLFQWDFEQPLITKSGAEQILSNLMSKFDGGLPASFNLNSPWGQPTSTQVPVYNSLLPNESIVQ